MMNRRQKSQISSRRKRANRLRNCFLETDSHNISDERGSWELAISCRMISKFFQSNPYQHLPQTWHDGRGLFVQSCCPKQIDGPALAYLRKRRNRLRGTQYSLIGSLILVTPYPQPGSKSARTSFFVLGSTDAMPYTETFSDTIV